jgi:hypothetical protein
MSRETDELLVKLVGALPTFYPWSIIPPDGKGFDPVQAIELPASGGGAGYSPGNETVVVSYTCPKGYSGLVKGIQNNYLGPGFNAALPSLTWRIRLGPNITVSASRFVENYANITVEFGQTNFPRPISGIHIHSGQTLIYTVTNNDTALPAETSVVVCGFSGLIWPEQRDKQGRVRG